ncbi:MAG TPA: hypothetical protein VGO73_01930 [Pyrinomonadaceae bacterium]|jgi:hypothetical protein|nr:hypothetical protein [Pyrinomonadaceae bacterium]
MSDPTPGDGGVIIIKGSSVHLNFDGTLYQKETGDARHRKHEGRKITRVMVQDEKDKTLFDSDQLEMKNEAGLKWTITVSTATK